MYNKALLLVGFMEQDFTSDVAKRISKSCNYLIIFSYKHIAKNLSSLNQFHIIDATNFDRVETIPFSFKDFKPFILDAEMQSHFYECRCFFFKTLDRVFIKLKSIREHEKYYNLLLCYWLSYINANRNKISKVVFSSVPHFPSGIVLFYVAKYYNIDIVIIRRTAISDAVVLDRDFRPNLSMLYKTKNDVKAQLPIERLLKISKNRSISLMESQKFNQRIASKDIYSYWLNSCFGLLKTVVKSIFNTLKNNTTVAGKVDYFKLTKLQTFLLKVNRNKVRLTCQKWLENNSVQPDLSCDYIYFALHFRPERSTIPEAHDYSDQISAIRLLSYGIPEGYKIYVKEHPRQLSDLRPDLRKTHFHSIKEYREITEIENVVIVDPYYSSEDLIRNCRLTATCTGSVAWEGLQLSKAGLSFGTTWHSSCKSSPVVDKVDLIEQQLMELLNKTQKEIESDVNEFLCDLHENIVCSAYSTKSALMSKNSWQVLANNLAKAIIDV